MNLVQSICCFFFQLIRRRPTKTTMFAMRPPLRHHNLVPQPKILLRGVREGARRFPRHFTLVRRWPGMEDDPPVALLLHLMEDKGSFRTFSLGCRPLKLSKLNDLGVETSS